MTETPQHKLNQYGHTRRRRRRGGKEALASAWKLSGQMWYISGQIWNYSGKPENENHFFFFLFFKDHANPVSKKGKI